MLYVADAIGLVVHPGATAIALMGVVRSTRIGPVYSVDDVVGDDPLVV